MNDPSIYIHFIQDLQFEVANRFADIWSKEDDLKLFMQPFSADAETVSTEHQTELIELQINSYLRSKFDSRDIFLQEFYAKYLNDLAKFPNLTNLAKKMICIFGSTYMREQLLSKMEFIKNKMRSKMTNEHLNDGLRLTSNKINADFEKLTRDTQHLKSY